jgi:dolichol-phosphate mannosyltransferase
VSYRIGRIHEPNAPPIKFLSIIIPARDEEGCIASTVEHLHLKLQLRGVPHEIIVDDDGSTDRTWQILQEEAHCLSPTRRLSGPECTLHAALRPVQNSCHHGFGCAITLPLDTDCLSNPYEIFAHYSLL